MDCIFKKHNVILAHCLTNSGGMGNKFSLGKNLYQRIDDVINNKPELSCSTIKEKDTLIHLEVGNFFGPVGIILKNTTIKYANSKDGGTTVNENGDRDYVLDDNTVPSETNIENAILNRHPKQYNELCTKPYDIFGFFLCFDDRVWLDKEIGNEKLFYRNTQKYGLPYFNLCEGVLIKADFNESDGLFYGSDLFQSSEIY